MSAFHNTAAGERLAMRFHRVCAAVGLLHLFGGIAMIIWHWRGHKDHEVNLKKLREAGL
jgi:hypothetical protein